MSEQRLLVVDVFLFNASTKGAGCKDCGERRTMSSLYAPPKKPLSWIYARLARLNAPYWLEPPPSKR